MPSTTQNKDNNLESRPSAVLRDPENSEVANLRRHAELDQRQVLEIGCGSGRLTRLLMTYTASIIGIDPCLADLQTARREPTPHTASRMICAAAPAETLPFAKQSFDTALFSWSL